MPLRGTHTRKHGIIVHTGVVDQDLNRPRLENPLERRARRRAVGDIEAHGFGFTAGAPHVAHESRRHLRAAV